MDSVVPENPYLLLTPGPLSTSKGVRYALLRDWCTWDEEYNIGIVQNIRARLVALATQAPEAYTAVLMQGSGSFSVEACLGSVVPQTGKLLILTNGAYGKRMVEMARVLQIDHVELAYLETEVPTAEDIEKIMLDQPDITHVAMVHCETTTGILNPIAEIASVVKYHEKRFIVDAMSSFGGIPLDMAMLGIDFLISSANKCLQGVPGFSFVIAKRTALEKCQGNARSLCLDLHAQWQEMDKTGKWRYTSPTHSVRALYQALNELEEEGGISARYSRYRFNHQLLVTGMKQLGFQALLPEEVRSPIITSFVYPTPAFDFADFYQKIKAKGFVLYPGKISQADTFRIGNIGDVHPENIQQLLETIKNISR